MSPSKPDAKDFQKETIKIFRTPEEGGKGTEIAVVRWIVDGRAFNPQLSNQEIYFDKVDRKRKFGKLKGFNLADWLFIMQHKDEIEALLKDSAFKKPPPVDTQSRAANDDTAEIAESKYNPMDEEVPF